ncbi:MULTISPECIES: hypothetical protein [unclassified Rhodococcus (in: high G+C Gram-positive bacteria)]|uniref:hypothetical protein n=1 Tax=unclassified Rhodococcus (in: high G+C Gram-positive bacteria) TaxID=192944 RepID=UPI0011400AEF|nr:MULTISPECIES: hypothetical protein [unclassified Rhodococcus (in: high G+C Gram-positive bacteria)]
MRIEKSLFRAPALSLASQAIGVVQLFALLWRHGASNATDAYFYLFNLGNLPTQILIVGVLYPMLLNEQRITRGAARKFGYIVSGVSLGAIALGWAWLTYTGRVTDDLIPIICLSAFNAAFQALIWHRAVLAEADGTPQWISAVALPANFLATCVILLPWPNSTVTVTAMMVALVSANGLFLISMISLRVGRAVLDRLPATSLVKHRAPWWFLAKSGVGYGGLMVVQSISLVLPPSTLTLLTVPMKIVASVSATFTNAILPRLIHQSSTSPEEGRRFLRLAAGGLAIAGTLLFLGARLFLPEYSLTALVIALWLVASAASSVAQRLAFRFLKPSASRITLIVVPVIVVATLVSSKFDGFGLISLLCAYAAVDAASGCLLLFALRDRLMAFVTTLILVNLGTIWLFVLAS